MFIKILNRTLIILFALPAILNSYPTQGNSCYPRKPVDNQAVYLGSEKFPVHGDGIRDDSEALQNAIDEVEQNGKFGIVFIPEGIYRITKTIYIWKGIRLIGYGAKRPVILLEKNTPGFNGDSIKYMIHFTSWKPREGQPIRDANPGTFYSALSNINFEIRHGNKGAVAVRSHFAQHCFLAHIDFHIGDGRAGVDEVGNEIEDCRFFGGDFGITTTKPSPSWPFLLIDSYFEGQRVAAIETEEGGMTLVRNHFKNVPQAIVVRPDRAEELFMEDCRFEKITQPAIVISDEYNARSQYNFKNLVCINVPVLAKFRKSGKTIPGEGKIYQVKDFSHGNQISDLDEIPKIDTKTDIKPLKKAPSRPASDIPALPPQDSWVNIVDLGAVGDDSTDNTQIILQAIEKHPTIYFPSGRYRVSETIRLKSNTTLIGLSPITTQLVLKDRTPGFHGPGSPKALLEAPPGGANIVTGIGLDGGGINDRAVAAKWMAGKNSMMNDVKFFGGHGTYDTAGNYLRIYNNNRTADSDRNRKWDSQYWSLWITGGGGTFKDIWTASPFAQAGIYISNTTTEGRIYAMSVEHHVRHEVQLKNVANWKIYALQMEEERGESWNALPMEIDNCQNIRFANLYLYRSLMLSPYPNGVVIRNSENLEFCGVHAYSPTRYTFDTTIYYKTWGVEIRSREIANLKISGIPPAPKPPEDESPVVDKTPIRGPYIFNATGFEFIDGAAVDAAGNVYFVDGRWHRIYRWSVEDEKLTKICDLPLSPMALAFDKSGNLLVTTKQNKVIAMNPKAPVEKFIVIEPEPARNRPGKTALLPGNFWRDSHDFLPYATQRCEQHFVSPDSSMFIPFFSDLRRSYSLRPAIPGQSYFMADEFGQKTYRFDVAEDGSLSNPKLFAEEGEFSVAVDLYGNVYVAAGDIFVYDKSGKQIDLIRVPERPTILVIGGMDKNILFVAARSSLYRFEIKI